MDTDEVRVDVDIDEDGDARGSSVLVPGTDSTGWRNRIVLSSARVSPWCFEAIVARCAF
jgi:hypothetical protein